tara:strand:+ start:9049 stop:9279 length:231 start_codon:yes stop_codon:yes gene_type:complete
MRAIRMTPQELQEYTKKLVAQQKNYQNIILETVAYSNGSLSYNEALQMSSSAFNQFEKTLVKKIKQDKGISESNML